MGSSRIASEKWLIASSNLSRLGCSPLGSANWQHRHGAGTRKKRATGETLNQCGGSRLEQRAKNACAAASFFRHSLASAERVVAELLVLLGLGLGLLLDGLRSREFVPRRFVNVTRRQGIRKEGAAAVQTPCSTPSTEPSRRAALAQSKLVPYYGGSGEGIQHPSPRATAFDSVARAHA